MTDETQSNQEEIQKTNSKEDNLVRMRQHYERQLEQERQARLEAEKTAQDYATKLKPKHEEDDEEDDSEPYIDRKKLKNTLNKFGQNTQSEIQKAMEMAKRTAKDELKQEMWLENNPDFYDTLQHAEKFSQKHPKLADTILRMPDGFERQKLVYHAIKDMGIDRPEVKAPSIQDKIDANRRSPYYQPTGVGSAPPTMQGDFSPSGKKNAFEKMQQLKKNLRMG